MWKESYRIGIDCIDKQHIELFHMTDNLLKAIETNAGKAVYQQTIEFLKSYVVLHFQDEEAYQASVHYSGIEAHKKAHRDFTQLVLEYETKLVQSDYDIRIVKDLAGTLTAWLIYHVADADQKIAGKQALSPQDGTHHTCTESFSASIVDVLEKMAGLTPEAIRERGTVSQPISEDVYVKIGFVGDLHGEAVFGFSQELAFKLIEIMTFTLPEEIDEFVCSALAELANISSGNAATELSQKGILCDITTPEVFLKDTCPTFKQPAEGFHIDTDIGGVQVAVNLVS